MYLMMYIHWREVKKKCNMGSSILVQGPRFLSIFTWGVSESCDNRSYLQHQYHVRVVDLGLPANIPNNLRKYYIMHLNYYKDIKTENLTWNK